MSLVSFFCIISSLNILILIFWVIGLRTRVKVLEIRERKNMGDIISIKAFLERSPPKSSE